MSISGHSQQTIEIWFLGTLSGSAGALGQDQDDAFMLVVDQFGGKLGGASVQVIRYVKPYKTYA